MEQLTSVLTQLKTCASRSPSAQALIEDVSIRQLLNSLQSLLMSNVNDAEAREEVVGRFAQNVFGSCLSTHISPVFSALYLAVLKVICHNCPTVVKTLTSWLLLAPTASHEEAVPVAFVCSLIREGLVLVSDLDHHYATVMSQQQVPALPFFEHLLLLVPSLLVSERLLAPMELRSTLDALSRFVSHAPQVLAKQVEAVLSAVRELEANTDQSLLAAGNNLDKSGAISGKVCHHLIRLACVQLDLISCVLFFVD